MTSNDIISKALAELPEAAPPEQLWPRILETRLDQERRRSRRLAWASTLTVTIGVALAAWQLSFKEAGPYPYESQMVNARVMEERLASAQLSSASLSTDTRTFLRLRQAELAQLDEALAKAYAERSEPAVLEKLWSRRVTILGEMLAVIQTGSVAI